MLRIGGFPGEIDSVHSVTILTVGGSVWRALYFAVSEGLWGASVGKAFAGIRVATPDGRPASLARVGCRSVVFVLSFDPDLPDRSPGRARESCSTMPGGALGFLLRFEVRLGPGLRGAVLDGTTRQPLRRCPRPRHGHAGRRGLVDGPTRHGAGGGRGRRAAFAARARGAVRGRWRRRSRRCRAGWSLGFDPVLTRPVWIRSAAADAPAVNPARRAVNRPTRLRWLAGRRAATDAWDAYSAPPGLPLLEACRTPRPWAEVRWWLLSLAQECLTARRESSLPQLCLERVRVVAGGSACLVDDPPYDAARVSQDAGAAWTTGRFLSQVAAVAMGRSRPEPDGTAAPPREPLPLGAGDASARARRPVARRQSRRLVARTAGEPAGTHDVAASPAADRGVRAARPDIRHQFGHGDLAGRPGASAMEQRSRRGREPAHDRPGRTRGDATHPGTPRGTRSAPRQPLPCLAGGSRPLSVERPRLGSARQLR